tara:strand:+ start:2022 stop:2870 length:849 start_codon:yes stop_codon:yes gene_type:complete
MTSTLGIKKIQYPNGTDIMTLDSSGSLAIGAAATVGGTLEVTGNTTLNGKFLIDGSNNDLMTFRTTGDTASQVLGLQFQNNSEAVTAQIFGTGDNSSSGVFRIKGIGNVDIIGGDIGVTGASADLRVHSGGVVSIPSGIELGSGVDATAANILDDYEEGTFTPTWNGYPSPHATSASYTKIGRQVIVYTELVTGNSQDFSEVQIDNLPFTISGNRGGGFVYHNQTGLYPYTPLTVMNANTTSCKLKTVVGAGSEAGVKYVDSGQPTLGGYTTLRWTIFYETS